MNQVIKDINEIFMKHGINEKISSNDIMILPNLGGSKYGAILDSIKIEVYGGDDSYVQNDGEFNKHRLSSIIADHLFSVVDKVCVYHYTSQENVNNILKTQAFRLTNIKKRYEENEIKPFYEYFPSSPENTDEMNREYFNTIVERTFYASFTELDVTQEEEQFFFQNFEGARLKIEIETSETNNNLRKIHYKHNKKSNILNKLTEMLFNKHCLKFTIAKQRIHSAFMLPQKFSHEKEIRALYNFPLNSTLDVKTEGMYSYIDVPLNIMDERTGFKFRILEVHAEERPDGMPKDIPFSKRDISKN